MEYMTKSGSPSQNFHSVIPEEDAEPMSPGNGIPERVKQHLIDFCRICVTGTPVGAFWIVVDKQNTISYLGRQIEAEYHYRYLVSEDGDETLGDPIRCDMIFFESKCLTFDDIIGEVLDEDDEVEVVMISKVGLSSGETTKRVIEPLKQAVSVQGSTAVLYDSSTPGHTSVYSMASVAHRSSRRPSFMLEVGNDTRMLSILNNSRSLELFMEFAIDDHCLESLLFWIDVQIYKSEVSSDSDIHRLYLYLTYTIRGAPLAVNITDEMRDDILLKSNLDYSRSSKLFDEAHRRVFSFLTGHVLMKFDQSEYSTTMITERAKGSLYSKLDQASYDRQYVLLNTFLPTRKHKIDRIHQLLAESQIGHKDLSLKIIREADDTQAMLMNVGVLRNDILGETLKHFFPNSKRLPLVQYFQERRRHSLVIKRRKQLKDRKLNKFFGDRPDEDQLTKQFATGALGASGILEIEIDVESTQQSMHSEATVEERVQLRKKVDKLADYFGAQIPEETLRNQSFSPDADNDTLIPNPLPFDETFKPVINSNMLKVEDKQKLTKRSQKLHEILGEVVQSPLAVQKDVERLSKTSMESMPRSGSLPGLTLPRKQTEDSKLHEYRRKKLKKIKQFLGEHIPDELVITPLSQRNTSHEIVDGEESLSRQPTITSDIPEIVREYRSTIQGLSDLLDEPQKVAELLGLIVTFEEDPNSPKELAPLLTPTVYSIGRSRSMNLADAVKARANKQTQKMAQFFGVKKDELIDIIETNIFNDLERGIDEDIEAPAMLALVKKEFRALKSKLSSAVLKSRTNLQGSSAQLSSPKE